VPGLALPRCMLSPLWRPLALVPLGPWQDTQQCPPLFQPCLQPLAARPPAVSVSVSVSVLRVVVSVVLLSVAASPAVPTAPLSPCPPTCLWPVVRLGTGPGVPCPPPPVSPQTFPGTRQPVGTEPMGGTDWGLAWRTLDARPVGPTLLGM
jgi:hypothetical protein